MHTLLRSSTTCAADREDDHAVKETMSLQNTVLAVVESRMGSSSSTRDSTDGGSIEHSSLSTCSAARVANWWFFSRVHASTNWSRWMISLQ